ncbi:calpain-7 isoform X2 [Cryptotermes secundus]|uniref:calpain-7 isoform X2 n=1 Tax=Cryptotermes secundus TaxID=105785 RepID=UPI000CD7B816|nr:calpain-7 isoform X2 [Cryptotermes secundus]
MSWNVQGLVEDALTSSTRAIQFDRDRQHEVAAFYYREAARFLELAISGTADDGNKESWTKKAAEYKERAQALDQLRLNQQAAVQSVVLSESQKQLQQCRFLLCQALDADEAGNRDEAVELYTQAVDLGIRARSSAQDPELQNKLASLARQALERAEELKGILPQVEEKPTSHVSVQPKLCSVPEYTSPNVSVQATAATNRGKYMVKLHINGIPRKVIIDDYLPVGKHGGLLCSYSTNNGELWISLLEKAYMKVMGGYDFPGSNSNIDLHALTGWIPERMSVRASEPDFNADALFDKLLNRLHKGDVLVTVATGEMSEAEADRSGLVPTHAYAVLDVRTVKGVRLLQLKNPWSHVRWRGNYSELDTKHWTPELRQTLNFDPTSAAMFDNGVFWIDYDSILRFYDVFYLNWNPGLFSYTYCIHQSWSAGTGPIKDAYNIGENPQFRMEVKPGASGAVWILLTRHITQIDDFRENREYITVLVYKNDGRRVYYPYDPAPFIDGVRINSPHYLCKIILNESSSHRYTLVISQYEKTNTIFYTLRAYATCPFTLAKISSPYEYTQKVTDGQWKGVTAGGCANHPTHVNNPCYQMKLESSHNNNQVLLDLRGPKLYQIGLEIICVVVNDQNAPGAFKRKHSGPFRSGFVVLALEDVPAGTYSIVPSTFLPNQEGPFILTVKASCPISLAQLQ